MRVGALCAGYGGLELGLQLAGIDTDLVWVSETDKHASVVLDARFGVPNLGDLTEIADPPQVDAITAGFPCQPVSHAGRRAGIDDERWLIRDVVSVAERAGAQWLFLENVRGVLTANQGVAYGQVLDALADGGFDARWACVRADQSVGACHRRDRWFCVAYASGVGREPRAGQLTATGRREAPQRATRDAEPGGGDLPAAYASGERHGGQQDGGEVGCVDGGAEGEASQRQRARQEPVDRGAASVGWGDYADAIARWEWASGRCAPAPVTDSKLSSRFVEWMMGLETDWVCGLGLPYRQELKLLGNGVMPHQAGVAFRWLLDQEPF